MNHTPNSLKQRQTNARAAAAKKRAALRCSKGHDDWGRNKKNGRRYCITCKVERNRVWRKLNKTRRPRVMLTSTGIQRSLTFEERQVLKQKVSDIQRKREQTVRRMWVDFNGNRVYLGGGAAPLSEQVRSGYSSAA